MTQIQLSTLQFDLTDIYAEGQIMSGREATVLNSVRAENIRNMLDKRLRRAPQGKQRALQDEAFIQQLRDECLVLDSTYRFARTGVASPLEEMIKQVAIEHAQAMLRAQGISPDPIELALLAGQLQQDDDIRREALTRLEEQKLAATKALEDLL